MALVTSMQAPYAFDLYVLLNWLTLEIHLAKRNGLVGLFVRG
jgi:hypothetical protein